MSSKGLRQVARAKNVVKIRVVENGEWRGIGLADENVMCIRGGGFYCNFIYLARPKP